MVITAFGRSMESDSSRSSTEYHDVVESANDSPGYFTPPPEKRKFFRSLTLRKKKSPSASSDTPRAASADEDFDDWTVRSPARYKKGQGSLRRFLSFRKKDKYLKRPRSPDKPTSSETLCEDILSSPEKIAISSRKNIVQEYSPQPFSLRTDVQVKYSKSETKSVPSKVPSKAPGKKGKGKSTSVENLQQTEENELNRTPTESLQIIEVDDGIPENILKAKFVIGSTEDTTSSRDTIVDVIDIDLPSTSKTVVDEAPQEYAVTEVIDVNPAISSRVLSRKTGIEVITVGCHSHSKLSHLVDPAITTRHTEKSRFEVITSGAEQSGNDIVLHPHKYPIKTRKRSDEYISIAFVNVEDEKISENLEGFTPPTTSLRNPLPNENTEKEAQNSEEDDSSESFKSTASPELRNSPENSGAPVDVARQNWTEPPVSPPAKHRKPFWRRLVGIPTARVYDSSKPPEGVLDGTMSNPHATSRKEKRNRASGQDRRDNAEPSNAKPQAAAPDDVPSAHVEEKKISGDDLRKQLSEGLKNGAAKARNAEAHVADKLKTVSGQLIESANDVKAQLSKITDTAAAVSAAETLAFLEQEKKEKNEKSIENSKEDKKGTNSLDGVDAAGNVPSTSKAPPQIIDMPSTDLKKEHLYKILVIGELGTGKTSIIKRYVHQFFSQHYRATIGVDFALKVINWDEQSIIRLQLWDIAGQERFGNMTRVYYKEAVGAFIVFDVTRAGTFDAVQKWKLDLDSKVQLSDGSPIPCILLANKCDQPKEGVVNNKNKMDEYCRENGFSGWYETSAKDNINVEEAARGLVLNILQNDKLRQGERAQDPDKIALGDTSSDSGGRSCNC